MRRTRGREVALQVLYQKDLNPGIPARELTLFRRRRLKNTPMLNDFTKALIKGVEEHKAELDARIQAVAENWRLDRMPPLDKNVLRIGLYEIQTGGEETPPSVAVNEAVDLAKRFGSAQSSKFINGLLDRFLPGHPAAFTLGDPLPEPPQPAPAEELETITPKGPARKQQATAAEAPSGLRRSGTKPASA